MNKEELKEMRSGCKSRPLSKRQIARRMKRHWFPLVCPVCGHVGKGYNFYSSVCHNCGYHKTNYIIDTLPYLEDIYTPVQWHERYGLIFTRSMNKIWRQIENDKSYIMRP